MYSAHSLRYAFLSQVSEKEAESSGDCQVDDDDHGQIHII